MVSVDDASMFADVGTLNLLDLHHLKSNALISMGNRMVFIYCDVFVLLSSRAIEHVINVLAPNC